VVPAFKVMVWNMDDLANKIIKITKNLVSIEDKPSSIDPKVGEASPVSEEKLPRKRGKKDVGIKKSKKEVGLKKSSFLLSDISPTHKVKYSTVSNNSISNVRFISNSSIKHIKQGKWDNTIEIFATMDIETITHNGIQVTIAISIAFNKFYAMFNSRNKLNINHKIFLIDKQLFIKNYELAINNIWKDFFEFIELHPSLFKTIFVHNLGSFDGLFIYKAISNQYDPSKVSTIIDDKNKFIKIQLKLRNDFNIVWKDSYRIFPVSLNSLCEVFKVSGKTSKYNPDYNNIELFNNESLLNSSIKYSIQDSTSLYEALIEAQSIYSEKYSVDITTVLSTSTLSLKIFRQRFLPNLR